MLHFYNFQDIFAPFKTSIYSVPLSGNFRGIFAFYPLNIHTSWCYCLLFMLMNSMTYFITQNNGDKDFFKKIINLN